MYLRWYLHLDSVNNRVVTFVVLGCIKKYACWVAIGVKCFISTAGTYFTNSEDHGHQQYKSEQLDMSEMQAGAEHIMKRKNRNFFAQTCQTCRLVSV